MPDLLLAADIGATNTRLRLVDAASLAAPLDEHTYGQKKAVDAAVHAFLERIGKSRRDLRAACFGVAGRVVEGDVRMTNRPDEVITDERLSAALELPKARVRVVNDMVAHMSGVDVSETVTLRSGRAIGDVEGIVMPGTGLGIGYAVQSAEGRRIAMPSEGGHLDFGPPSSEHDLLLVYARAQRAETTAAGESADERISWEWFVSGPGLARLYACLSEDLKAQPAAWQQVEPSDVTARATGQSDALDADTAIRATRTFLELTGARAGNLCLDLLATAGVYLGGNILNLLYDDNPQHFVATLLEEFEAAGPDALRETLQNVPLHLIRSPDSGLRGAAALAQALIELAD